MTLQPGYQAITIRILTIISLNKGNQPMKFDQLIKYNKINFFIKNHAENEAGRLVVDFFVFFKKVFVWDKNKCSTA